MPFVTNGQAHSAWAERFCREVGSPHTSWPNSKVPQRQLRLGYISPDFFHHSVSFFEQFEIFIYSNATREDDKTEVFKSLVPSHRWRKVVGMSAVDASELIRADQIDILVELAGQCCRAQRPFARAVSNSGHTANNRLDVIALKPAPVQITYIGYNNTTGLGAIDYRLVDEIVDPLDTTQPFSEELVRVPGCFLCYTPPTAIPDVQELPALRNGFVTFGSFSCLAKVGDPVVALWARCLHEVPNSRLLVKNKGFYSPDVQATFIAKFKAFGIPEQRLKLMSLAPTSYEHLNIYNEAAWMELQERGPFEAIETCDAENIHKSLVEACNNNVSDSELIFHAREMLDHLLSLRQQLLKAVESMDLQRLHVAVEESAQGHDGLPEKDLASALRILDELKAVVAVGAWW
eukprot:g171.t1